MPKLARAFGLDPEGKTNHEVMEEITQTLIDWEKDIGCYRRLSEFGAKEEDFDQLVESTFAQTRVLGHSSWQLTADELKEIFKKAM